MEVKREGGDRDSKYYWQGARFFFVLECLRNDEGSRRLLKYLFFKIAFPHRLTFCNVELMSCFFLHFIFYFCVYFRTYQCFYNESPH